MRGNKLESKVLKRERVNNKLDLIFQCPIVVVAAPMGYGKTTAVRAFLENYRFPCIWVAMSESVMIAASEYFWYLMIKEVYKYFPSLASSLEERGFPNDSVQISRIIDVIQLSEISQDVVIVIDDYHLIENKQINLFLERLALENIPWLHIVLISRRIPELYISEFSLKGICYFIESKDLSFTEDEINNYFDLVKFQADDEIKQKIASSSSGWIAAVYLMMTSFAQDLRLESYNSIYAMLKSSFFDKYDFEMKTLLFKLSLFDIITSEQAVYILEDKEVIRRLEQLCRENAFIALDDEGKYKFHQIFLDFLRKEKLGWDVDMRRTIQRAGRWYSNHGDNVLAFKYWLMAEDYETIFIELEMADITSINLLDKKLLFQIFEHAQEEQKYKYPIATLKYISFIIHHVDKKLGAKMLESLEQYFAVHSHDKYSKNRIFAEINIINTTIAFNDAEVMTEYSRKALELLGEEHSIIRTQNSVLTYGSPHFTYAYYNKIGEYKKITEILSIGYESHIRVTNGCGMGCNYLAIAEYDLETGSLENVELNAVKSIYLAKTRKQTCIIVCAKLTLARLYILQGRQSDIQSILDELVVMAKTEINAINLNVIDNCVGYIYACLEQYENIPKWLRNGDMTVCNSIYQGAAFNYIVNGKAVLLLGDFIELEMLTESFVDYFNMFRNQLGFIHNHIHNAVAKYNLYGMDRGVQELQKALNIGMQDDVVMPFVENVDFILPMLTSGLIVVSKDYLDHILSFCDENKKSINQNKNKIKGLKKENLLSARELEVLTLLESGKSQKSVAEKLCISQNTVKRHVQNIYQKLDVKNKTLAFKKLKQ